MSDFPDAAAEVADVGMRPEDKCTIMNFEQISEGQKLYSKDALEDHSQEKFSIGCKKGKEAARIGLVTLIKNQEITEIEEVVRWCCERLESFEAEEVLEEITETELSSVEQAGQAQKLEDAARGNADFTEELQQGDVSDE